jgi:diacylglycerol kinase (ATP)
MGKKIAVISNPFSGTSSKKNLAQNIEKWNDGFFDVLFLPTEYKGHTSTRVKEALEKGAEIIVAAGGDGTVNEVVSELYHTDRSKTLAILPAGSGNGFAMHLGLGRDLKKAFDFIKEGKTMLVDTCKVNDKIFINVSGIGFDARIAYLTKKSSSRGFKRYFLTSIQEIRNFSALPMNIELDNGVFINDRFGAAIIANATMFGYNFSIAPTAQLNDGLFDIVLFKDASVMKYLYNSYRMLTKSIHKSDLVTILRSKEVTIKTQRPDYYHIDGEGFMLEEELHYSIDPLSLNVITGDRLVI